MNIRMTSQVSKRRFCEYGSDVVAAAYGADDRSLGDGPASQHHRHIFHRRLPQLFAC